MNRVILIGTNNITLLGAVRNFGTNNIKPDGIIIAPSKGFVEKSKYWNKIYRVADETNVKKVLIEKFASEDTRPVVISCTDGVSKIIDENLEELSKYFIIPSFNNKQNELASWMDKFKQAELAKEVGYNMLECEVVSLLDAQNTPQSSPIEYPIILKPNVSASGKKSDMLICYNDVEWTKAIAFEKNQGYDCILVQKFLEKRSEIGLCGAVSSRNKFLSFSLVRNIRSYPPNKGVGSYSQHLNENKYYIVAKQILETIIEKGYSGPIDIDLFEDESGKIYICEFNWRVSGRCFVDLNDKRSALYRWFLNETGQAVFEHGFMKKEGFVVNEETEYLNMLNGNIEQKKWKEDTKKATAYSLWLKEDPLPALLKYRSMAYVGFVHKISKHDALKNIIKMIIRKTN